MPEARTPAGALSAADQRTVIVGLLVRAGRALDPRRGGAAVDARGAGQRGARVEDPPAQVAGPARRAGRRAVSLISRTISAAREVGVEVADQRAGGRRPSGSPSTSPARRRSASRRRRWCGTSHGGCGGSPSDPVSSVVGPGREGAEDPRRPAGRRARVVGAVGGERDLRCPARRTTRARRRRRPPSPTGPCPPRGRARCPSAAGGRPGSPARRSARRRRPRPSRRCARRRSRRRRARPGWAATPGSVPKLMLIASAPWSTA